MHKAMPASSRQNDRIWAKEKTSTPHRLVSKPPGPAEIMVCVLWGEGMSAQVLADLHVVPQKQSVDVGYYVTGIL